MQRPGWNGWLLVALVVILWDKYERDSLSAAFYLGAHSPKTRLPVIAAWVIVSAHLFKLLPRKLDPVRWIGKAVRPK